MSDRYRHGDPFLRVALSDGLEDDREQLRRAVDAREICHPFTTMRFDALGWTTSQSRYGNFLLSMPIPHPLTEEGIRQLSVARKAHHSRAAATA